MLYAWLSGGVPGCLGAWRSRMQTETDGRRRGGRLAPLSLPLKLDVSAPALVMLVRTCRASTPTVTGVRGAVVIREEGRGPSLFTREREVRSARATVCVSRPSDLLCFLSCPSPSPPASRRPWPPKPAPAPAPPPPGWSGAQMGAGCACWARCAQARAHWPRTQVKRREEEGGSPFHPARRVEDRPALMLTCGRALDPPRGMIEARPMRPPPFIQRALASSNLHPPLFSHFSRCRGPPPRWPLAGRRGGGKGK